MLYVLNHHRAIKHVLGSRSKEHLQGVRIKEHLPGVRISRLRHLSALLRHLVKFRCAANNMLKKVYGSESSIVNGKFRVVSTAKTQRMAQSTEVFCFGFGSYVACVV